MRASKFVLVAFAFAGIFLAIAAASALVARAVRAQLSVPSHRSEHGVSKPASLTADTFSSSWGPRTPQHP